VTNRVRSREDWALWLSFLAPIGSWVAAQQVSFILSPWVCNTGRRWVLYVVMAAALAVAAAGAAASARETLRQPEDAADDPVRSRRKFMALGALASSAFFFVAIVALAIPVFVHRPCD
jgi:hypothetical protein